MRSTPSTLIAFLASIALAGCSPDLTLFPTNGDGSPIPGDVPPTPDRPEDAQDRPDSAPGTDGDTPDVQTPSDTPDVPVTQDVQDAGTPLAETGVPTDVPDAGDVQDSGPDVQVVPDVPTPPVDAGPQDTGSTPDVPVIIDVPQDAPRDVPQDVRTDSGTDVQDASDVQDVPVTQDVLTPPVCVFGEMRFCYSGPLGTLGVGLCHLGGQFCIPNASGSPTWGPCLNEVTPTAEICDTADNDCDGQTNEGFDIGSACTSGVGTCSRTGTRVCSPDRLGTVCGITAGTPTAETCNGLDDNCNGLIDDGINLQGDVDNCGSCGNQCNNGQVCVTGVCTRVCTPNLTVCGDTCRDLRSDRNNCGSCGTTCLSGRSCAAGLCGICGAGYQWCATSDTTAMCRSLSDPNNCGGCGNRCADNQICHGTGTLPSGYSCR